MLKNGSPQAKQDAIAWRSRREHPRRTCLLRFMWRHIRAKHLGLAWIGDASWLERPEALVEIASSR